MLDTANADQDTGAGSLLDERHLFGVEKAERTFRLKMTGKTIEQGLLVQVILHPLGIEPQIGFPFGLHIKPVFPAHLGHRLAQHPGERHGGR